MIEDPTVFVLGAGASWAYGFPVGKDLVSAIVDEADTDKGEYEKAGFSNSDVHEFVHSLSKSDISSIDSFLTYHDKFNDLGRFAIALHLARKEDEKLLNRYRNEHAWYHYLIDPLLKQGPHNLPHHAVTFITFNYDRSLEQYIWNRLRFGCQLNENEAARILGQVPIRHMHGQLGRLKWQSNEASEYYREYCTEVNIDDVVNCSRVLRVIHDGIDESFIQDIQRVTKDARNVFFLGFGFHEVNMNRLGLTKSDIHQHKQTRGLYATLFGMENAEIDHFCKVECPGVIGSADNVLLFLKKNGVFQRLFKNE